MPHRHQHRRSVCEARAGISFPARHSDISSPDDDQFTSFDAVPGTPTEWLFIGLASGEINPSQIQWNELDGLLELANSELKGSKPSECTEVLMVLSRLLASAQSPEIGVPVAALLTDTFRDANPEMQKAIRKVVPEIDSLMTITAFQRNYT